MGITDKVRVLNSPLAISAYAGAAILLIAYFTHQISGFVVGIGSGALIAALGICITISYKGSGVVNVAAGAMAMYSSWTYADLKTSGHVPVLPLPNPLAPIEWIVHSCGGKWNGPSIPTAISFGGPKSTVVALLITVIIAALSGAAIQIFFLRPLRFASPLAKVIVMVGLLMLLVAAVTVRFGSDSQSVPPILDSRGIEISKNLTIPVSYLILLAGVIVLACVLAALFRWTRFGTRTRAAAENEKGAVLLGFSPEMLATINWMMAGAIAALVGVFAATLNQAADTTTITFLAVPALAATLLGGFRSFTITVAAGIGIGMVQSWVQSLGGKSWFPKVANTPLPGAKELFALLLIVLVLYVRARGIPERGSLHRIPLPFAPEPRRVGTYTLIGTAVVTASIFLVGPAWRLGLINTMIGVVVCLSLVVVTGFVGQISLAQMALAGVTAFFLSKLATAYRIPFPLAPILAILAAMVVGLVVALPALRIRGVGLAVATFAAGFAIEQAVFVSPFFSNNGASTVPSLGVGNWHLSVNSRLGGFGLPNPLFGVLCVVVTAVALLMIVNLRVSIWGERMLAVRSNERAAAAAGVNVAATKLFAFAIAAGLAGVAGVLAAYCFGSASDTTFGGLASLSFLAFAYLGGISRISGAICAGTLVAGGLGAVMMQNWIHVNPVYTDYLGGIAVILTAIQNPDGIAGGWAKIGESVRKRWSKSVPVSRFSVLQR